MVKIISSLILMIGLLASAFVIHDGLAASAPTHGIVLDDGDVVVFHRGKTRRCGFYEGDAVGCSQWSN